MNVPAAANVTAEIFSLTRSELDASDGECGPFIGLPRILGAMDLFRIHGLAEFWKDARENIDDDALPSRFEDLISGWHGQGRAWAFVLRAFSHRIECGFGVQRSPKRCADVGAALRGALPGPVLDGAWDPFADGWMPSSAESLSVTGIPSRKEESLERLCRGLYGKEWAYIVYAQPRSRKDARVDALEFESRSSEIQQAFLYKDAVPNRIAERLMKLLERQTKRFDLGRSVGMWNAHTFVSVRQSSEDLELARGLVLSAFAGNKSTPEPLRVRDFSGAPREDNTWTILTTDEMATLAKPPSEDQPGLEILPDVRFGVQPVAAAGEFPISIGEIWDRGHGTGNRVSIAQRDLTKHGLIVGVTGSGKTNTCFELLAQIWRSGKGVPFMVLESAKSEYRDLLNDPRFTGLRVFTIGDETIAPLRLNPFEVPEGVLVQSHIDYLKALFSAAFVLYPPMPYVLDQALHEVYEDYGWDLASNRNPRGPAGPALFPTLDDLVEKTRSVVKGLGYDTRLEMDVQAGLTARLDSLRRGGGKGPMLNTRLSVTDADLFERPCVLEMKQIVSDDEKAFFIGLLLIRLHEYYESRAQHRHDGGLRHVTLIEEAHRLLRNVSTEQGSEVSANPKGQAIEVFGNMLAEIRAFGEGVLIAEQVPTKLLTDAIKNTNLKIVHRLVAADDRDLIGNAMNLSDEQNAFLTRLRTGEAVSYAEGASKPVLIKVDLADVKRSGGRVDGATVGEAMREFYAEREQLRFPHHLCASCPFRRTATCCGATGKIDEDLLIAGKAVINAARLGDQAVAKLYDDFTGLARRRLGLLEQAQSRCLFAGVLSLDMYRRAATYAWSDAQADLGEAVIAKLVGAIERGEGIGGEALERSASVFADFEQREGPFTGCSECPQKCRYRFDMASDRDGVYERNYNAAFAADSVSFEERWRKGVIPVVVERATRGLGVRQDGHLMAAAYCFGVQQHSAMKLSEGEQKVAARALLKGLRA